MLEIGISGGTYDPVHNWHLLVGECARDQFGFHETLFISNGDPVHKAGRTDKELRWSMLAAGCASNPYFRASRIEVDRPGKSYMLDTLKEVKRHYGPDCRLNLIIGLDTVEPIMTWYSAHEVLHMVRLLVAPRYHELADKDKIRKALPCDTDFDVIDCPTSSISSSLIRERVRLRKTIKYMVPPEVEEMILRHELYRDAA